MRNVVNRCRLLPRGFLLLLVLCCIVTNAIEMNPAEKEEDKNKDKDKDSKAPNSAPTRPPSKLDTQNPTNAPTNMRSPTSIPTRSPTSFPSRSPTSFPTRSPTSYPSRSPTPLPPSPSTPPPPPTKTPTNPPVKLPTLPPTKFPTQSPTNEPVVSRDIEEFQVALSLENTGTISINKAQMEYVTTAYFLTFMDEVKDPVLKSSFQSVAFTVEEQLRRRKLSKWRGFRKRTLQDGGSTVMNVKGTIVVGEASKDSWDTNLDMIRKEAFQSENYVSALQLGDISSEPITASVSIPDNNNGNNNNGGNIGVLVDDNVTPINSKGGGGNSTGIAVGGAFAGLAAIALATFGLVKFKRKKGSTEKKKKMVCSDDDVIITDGLDNNETGQTVWDRTEAPTHKQEKKKRALRINTTAPDNLSSPYTLRTTTSTTRSVASRSVLSYGTSVHNEYTDEFSLDDSQLYSPNAGENFLKEVIALGAQYEDSNGNVLEVGTEANSCAESTMMKSETITTNGKDMTIADRKMLHIQTQSQKTETHADKNSYCDDMSADGVEIMLNMEEDPDLELPMPEPTPITKSESKKRWSFMRKKSSPDQKLPETIEEDDLVDHGVHDQMEEEEEEPELAMNEIMTPPPSLQREVTSEGKGQAKEDSLEYSREEEIAGDEVTVHSIISQENVHKHMKDDPSVMSVGEPSVIIPSRTKSQLRITVVNEPPPTMQQLKSTYPIQAASNNINATGIPIHLDDDCSYGSYSSEEDDVSYASDVSRDITNRRRTKERASDRNSRGQPHPIRKDLSPVQSVTRERRESRIATKVPLKHIYSNEGPKARQTPQEEVWSTNQAANARKLRIAASTGRSLSRGRETEETVAPSNVGAQLRKKRLQQQKIQASKRSARSNPKQNTKTKVSEQEGQQRTFRC